MNASDWMNIAKAEIGVKEIKGPEHNERIIDYHSVTTYGAPTDEIPWCSSFVCWVLSQAGIYHTRSAASLSYLDWGIELKEPCFGCIAVLTRKGGGHVGFWTHGTEKTDFLLGGNQGNAVKSTPYSKSRVKSYRWPKTEYFNLN